VTFARLHIIPHLDAFLAEHPNLTIDVVLDDRNIDLLEEGIDVALRMGTLGDSGMTAQKGCAKPSRGWSARQLILPERANPQSRQT